MKIKTKILLWSVFWYITRTLLTSSVVVATLLTLWNLSYKIRGYYAFGGELILVVIFGILAHLTGKILHDWHKKAMYKVLKEEAEQTKPQTATVKLMCDGKWYTITQRNE